MVWFLHVSDIHFRRRSGAVTDIDEDLRNELVLDAGLFADSNEKPDGILISGDIAFSGQKDEYETAKKWTNQLCEAVGRDGLFVWCVPGNHDVDQSKVRNGPILETLHQALRNAGEKEIDELLDKYLRDASAGTSLFSTIDGYNKWFARNYECEITREQPFWHRSFVLNDSSVLRVNGINSTIVSNHQDNSIRSIIVGRYQLPRRQTGVVDLLLCHHPPDWWQDADQLADDMENRCRIQLFGHKHVHRLKRINETVVVSSGAVHPDRQEDGWQPRYNWIHVNIDGVGDNRELVVRVFPRVWSNHDTKFIPDTNSCKGREYREHKIKLEEWTAPTLINKEEESDRSVDGAEPLDKEGTTVNRGRILTYRFFELPHVLRLDTMRELNLIDEEDEGITDTELFRRIMERARERGQLAELWDKVQRKHGDGKYSNNPYRAQEETS